MYPRRMGTIVCHLSKPNIVRVISLTFIFLFILMPHTDMGLAQTVEVPRPIGDIYVQDFADVLSQTEENEIRQIGRAIEDQTTNQLSVLTVKSLGEASVEEYANEAFRNYGIGTTENNNGVLLLLAMTEQKIRIEVGYGLEAIIPDGKAGRIIDRNAIPYLQNGQPNIAIMNTYQALANEVAGEATNNSSANVHQQESPFPSWLLIILVVGLIFLDIKFFGGMITFSLLSILSRSGRGGGPRGGGGGSSGGGGASRGW